MVEESKKNLLPFIIFLFFCCFVLFFFIGLLKIVDYTRGLKMSEEPKQTNCPNCLGQAIKEGNKIICETCDATFTFNKTGGAKVKEIGRLDNIEKRLDQHDNLLQGLLPEPEPEPKLKDKAEESSLLGN